MKLTDAQRRGLEAVRAGSAFRRYTEKGNTVHCAGVGSAVIWKLEALRLIRETHNTDRFELTDEGRRLLWENPRQ